MKISDYNAYPNECWFSNGLAGENPPYQLGRPWFKAAYHDKMQPIQSANSFSIPFSNTSRYPADVIFTIPLEKLS
ncbi:MAG: hypothetical protein CTY16_11900 [Methylobacter sp.]|nr:MAG: hypothetical protein CTY16_11900 [Methylobacter sp.]